MAIEQKKIKAYQIRFDRPRHRYDRSIDHLDGCIIIIMIIIINCKLVFQSDRMALFLLLLSIEKSVSRAIVVVVIGTRSRRLFFSLPLALLLLLLFIEKSLSRAIVPVPVIGTIDRTHRWLYY